MKLFSFTVCGFIFGPKLFLYGSHPPNKIITLSEARIEYYALLDQTPPQDSCQDNSTNTKHKTLWHLTMTRKGE